MDKKSERRKTMSDKEYEARIMTKKGGSSVLVRVFANNGTQAREIIEARPEFKSFAVSPREVRK